MVSDCWVLVSGFWVKFLLWGSCACCSAIVSGFGNMFALFLAGVVVVFVLCACFLLGGGVGVWLMCFCFWVECLVFDLCCLRNTSHNIPPCFLSRHWFSLDTVHGDPLRLFFIMFTTLESWNDPSQ